MPFFKVEYIKIPILNFSDYFTTITLSYWQHNIKKLEWVPYNGIFSRRQIFAVLSQKHGAYFSRILIFAVGNVREK